MKKYVMAAMLLLASTAYFAAAQVPNRVYANVPFQFFVGSKSFPAGTYRFTANVNLSEITVSTADGKNSVMAPVITRVSPRPTDQAAAVFDLVGSDHYLSEIYIPELDGFLVKGAAQKHSHVVVKGK
jgi:hypothetical protein